MARHVGRYKLNIYRILYETGVLRELADLLNPRPADARGIHPIFARAEPVRLGLAVDNCE
jgi:hypothetical protein